MLTTAKSEAPGDRSSQSCIEPLTTLKNRKVSCLLIAAFEWVTLLPPLRVDGHATAVIWTSADRVTGTLLCDSHISGIPETWEKIPLDRQAVVKNFVVWVRVDAASKEKSISSVNGIKSCFRP